MNAKQDPRVILIRADIAVGSGSCTNVDECYSDEELVEELDLEKIDLAGAVEWARELAGLWLEKGLEQRWGDDCDSQLTAYKEFKQLCES